jgi:hypothetical protein
LDRSGRMMSSDYEERPSMMEMVGNFVDHIGEEFPEASYEELIQALLAGAGHLSCIWGESLDMFKARAVIAYESMKKITVGDRTFGRMASESIVTINDEDQN